MAGELFKLFGTIAINNSDANASIDETTGKAEESSKSLSDGIATAAKWGAAITAAAAAAGAAIYNFATQAAQSTDRIDKMSQKIGISREAFQELDFICSQSGTSVDGLQAGMKTLIAAMDGAASGTESNVAQFKKLGVEVTNADGSLRNSEDVMWDVFEALQKMDNQTEKARLATELFGRSGTELMPLLNGASGSIDEMRQKAHDLGLVLDDETIDAGVAFTDALDQVKRALGSVVTQIGVSLMPMFMKLYDWIMANLPTIQAVIETVFGILAQVVETAVSVIGDIIGALQDFIGWLSSGSVGAEAFKVVVIAVTAAIVAFKAVLAAQAVWTTLISLIGKAKIAFAAFNAVLAANPIGLIIAAIAALVSAFIYLWNNCEGFREFWINLWNKIKEIAGKVADWFKEAWGAVVDWFKGIWESVSNFFTGLWNGIKRIIDTVVNWIKENWQAMLLFLINPLAGIFKYMYDHFEGFRNFINNIVNSIKEFFINLWNKIKEIWNGIVQSIKTAVENIKTTVTNVFNAVKNVVTNIWNGIKNTISNVWNAIKSAITTVINAIKTVITTVFNAIKTTITTILNAIKTVITTVWNAIKTAVTTAVNALKTVITTVFNAIKNTVTSIWNGIKTTITNVWNGIKSGVTNAVNAVKNTISNVFNGVKTTVTNIWNGIRDAIKKPIEKARDLVKGAIDKIKGFFKFKFEWPKIKMPHFGISPKGWKIGDLLKGSIPKLSIDWYAKAMDNPIIMKRPTLFGINGNGELMAGGESGAEVVSGANTLMGMIRSNVRNEISGTEQKIETLISMLAEYLPEIINNSNKQIVLNNGVLVGELASDMDSRLGELNRLRERGR